jgi:hypothetical protein
VLSQQLKREAKPSAEAKGEQGLMGLCDAGGERVSDQVGGSQCGRSRYQAFDVWIHHAAKREEYELFFHSESVSIGVDLHIAG